MNYYKERKAWFLKKYWNKDHNNLYTPNGIKSRKDLVQNFSFLFNLIRNDGKIIDMGCGNGLLLRFVINNSEHKLIPYGVDFLKKSIKQAKGEVLPEFKENFFVGNVMDYVFTEKFDYILTAPDYVSDEDIKLYYNKCFNALNLKGMLIFYIHIPEDASVSFQFLRKRIKTIKFFKSRKFKWVRSTSIVFGYIARNKNPTKNKYLNKNCKK